MGTGDSLALNYMRNAVTRSHIVKNFFVDNYDHPMFEDGKQLVDMIYLREPYKS